MNKTNIDWPGLGYSWNPIVGCANNCPYCYARKISNRFKMIPDFTKPVFFPERIDEPCRVTKPATIFVGSMCDIFSEGVKSSWIHHIIETAKICNQHTFMFLTKKPENYRNYNWPGNCYLGATVEHYEHSWRKVEIQNLNNNKTFLSIEPIFSDFYAFDFKGIDLIIVGADSSKGAKIPPLEWVKSINHPNIYYKANLRKHYPELKNSI